jgi:D-sedoheptulose 7-phosphate isomerase/D-glycero-D-manno-heptose 1,7-bisphosphate phosphatase
MTAATDPIATLGAESNGTTQKFPSLRYGSASSYCDAYFEESARAATTIDWMEVDRAARILSHAYATGAHVFSCGNGGSAAIANHLQCDHVKGIRTETDLFPRVTSLSTNIELLTAIANDIGYEDIFTFQLESQSRPGDILIAISSSGRSANIVSALSWARDNGMHTIALTGFTGGRARSTAAVAIHVASENYGVIEDLHQGAMHAIAQYIRQSRMSVDAVVARTF